MIKGLGGVLSHLAYRRAFNAIHSVRETSWYMVQLLENRLTAGLATPADILASACSLKTKPLQHLVRDVDSHPGRQPARSRWKGMPFFPGRPSHPDKRPALGQLGLTV